MSCNSARGFMGVFSRLHRMHSESAQSSGVSAAAGEVINEPTVVESFGVSRVLLANERCALPNKHNYVCMTGREEGGEA